ncbi:hypothetical protein A0H81_02180 [Grifola frondosa]|uniref:Uncharacterized protein n=1 Tax=Grifola frondosa TaxID=5627 RepID=A0A1C7MNK7_GRIFR|nr:hypothetical protein A0H81_02180 [Grifola frondosa]
MHGDTMAQIRLHELLIDDILYCWQQSLLDENSRRQQLDVDTGIHLFFVDRVRGDTRMVELQEWPGLGCFRLTFTELITAKICINASKPPHC